MGGVGVDDDCLAEVAVEVFQVLDVLAVLVLGSLAAQRPHDEVEGVELLDDRVGHGDRDGGEEDELVVLRQVADEVVDAGALGGAVAVLAVPGGVNHQVFERQDESERLALVLGDCREELRERRLGVVAKLAAHASAYTRVHAGRAPAAGQFRLETIGDLLALAERTCEVCATCDTASQCGEEHVVERLVPPAVQRGLVVGPCVFFLVATLLSTTLRLCNLRLQSSHVGRLILGLLSLRCLRVLLPAAELEVECAGNTLCQVRQRSAGHLWLCCCILRLCRRRSGIGIGLCAVLGACLGILRLAPRIVCGRFVEVLLLCFGLL